MAHATMINTRQKRAKGLPRLSPATSAHPPKPSTRVNGASTAGALAHRLPASHL
jgi:hypothetical protein